MTGLSIGDIARSFHMRHAHARLRAQLQQLGTELTSGKTDDLRAATGGNLGALAGLEQAIGTLGSYRLAANEASLFVSATQRALDTVQKTGADIGPALLQAAGSGHPTLVQTAATDARTRFSTLVSVLNTRVGDRSLLAGTQTDKAPLADAETMLADLQGVVATETTAAGVEAAVTAWFDTPGGGFETSGYHGGSSDLAPFRIGPDETATHRLRADAPELRNLMKGYAMAALVSAGSLATDTTERAALLEASATRLLTGDRAIAEIQSGVGVVEAQIDDARTRNNSEMSAIELARSQILAVDPYRTATNLQAVQTQLETLYTVTARLAHLTLAEYLR